MRPRGVRSCRTRKSLLDDCAGPDTSGLSIRAVNQWCRHGPRADRVDADTLARVVRRDLAHNGDDPSLGRCVRSDVGHTDESGNTGRDDDRAAGTIEHVGERASHGRPTPVRLVRSTRSQSSRGVLTVVPGPSMPAFATAMSSEPAPSITSAASEAIASTSATSTALLKADQPSDLRDAATASSWSSPR